MANLTVAWFGPSATIVNAFLFIGLDLTSRDKLHEAWSGRGLAWKMGLLIGTGSLISWLLNRGAGQIALASFVAFACAGLVDTIVFHVLRDKTRLVRINGSNVFSAAVDSIIFPVIAFGFPLMFGIMAGQFLAKVLGGFIWYKILGHHHKWEKFSRDLVIYRKCKCGKYQTRTRYSYDSLGWVDTTPPRE